MDLHPDFSGQQSAESDGNLHQVVETERKAGLEKMGQIYKNFFGRALIGNEPIKAYLQKAVAENQLPQTLLFVGPDGVGKGLFARALAAELLRSDRSPDLHILAPEGKSGLYAIDTLREMMEKEHAAPFQAPGKVFILEEADRMQPASANALLKTLEEPSADTTFILLSSNIQEILPTILSRCTILNFQSLGEKEIESILELKGHPKNFAKLSHGSAGRAFELAMHPELEEQRKILFALLADRPPYHELSFQLDRLESLVEEGKEEDPVRANRRIEHLFSSVLMWHRDQHARSMGLSHLLFFSDQPERTPVPLHKVEKALDQARLAYHRNIKISVCLKYLF